jgi:hypothetical protein
MRIFISFLFAFVSVSILAQEKVSLSPEDFNTWNRLNNKQISSDGSVISYQITPGFGDRTLKIHKKDGSEILSYKRAESSKLTWDSNYAIFIISPGEDTVRALKRLKTKEKDLPKDSLGIFNITGNQLTKIASIIDFKIPEKWSGYVAYRLDEMEKDSTEEKSKPVNKENGYPLVVQNLESGSITEFKYITEYTFAKKGKSLVAVSTGSDSTLQPTVYHLDLTDQNVTEVMTGKYVYKYPVLSEDGMQTAFLVDTASGKEQIKNHYLAYWKKGTEEARLVADSSLLNGWIVNADEKPYFSENGSRLFFGTQPKPLVQDTSLLEDEIIKVEIWNYQDQRLQTQQEKEKEDDLKKSYLSYWDPSSEQIVRVTSETIPFIRFGSEKRNKKYALGYDNQQYLRYTSWEGFPPRSDFYLLSL